METTKTLLSRVAETIRSYPISEYSKKVPSWLFPTIEKIIGIYILSLQNYEPKKKRSKRETRSIIKNLNQTIGFLEGVARFNAFERSIVESPGGEPGRWFAGSFRERQRKANEAIAFLKEQISEIIKPIAPKRGDKEDFPKGHKIAKNIFWYLLTYGEKLKKHECDEIVGKILEALSGKPGSFDRDYVKKIRLKKSGHDLNIIAGMRF